MTKLFEKSFRAVILGAIQAATKEVDSLDRTTLLAPSLAGTLDKIAAKYTLQVATLRPERKVGKRRDVTREGNDGFGERRTQTVSVIDVTIPFDGEAQSLEMSPSTSSLIYGDFTVSKNSIVLTLPDDESLERDVNDFVKQASENLDQLRKEVARDLPQVRAAIEERARQRQAIIKNERERDSKRGFPIE